MKKILFLLIGVLLLGGCATASAEEGSETQEPVIEYKAVQVEAAQKHEMTGALVIPGKVEANAMHAVNALVSGEIKSIEAEVGDYVEAGTVLAKVDDEFVRLQRSQTEIGNNLYALALDSAKRTYERSKALYDNGSLTQADYDGALDMLSKAKLDYAMGQNSLNQIDYQLRNMTVKAPISGVVSGKYTGQGAAVNPGAPLFEIVDISNVVIEAGTTEANINRLSVGQGVTVELPAAGLTIEGTVEGVGPIPGDDGTYPIRVSIENTNGSIKPGMYAELRIMTEAAQEVLSLPKIAVMHENGKDYVFVSDGVTAEKREITKGIAFDVYFQIEAGVTEGELVVTAGQAYLSSGDYIEIIE